MGSLLPVPLLNSLWVLGALLLACQAVSSQRGQHSNRQNLFEPLFALDDIDAITISQPQTSRPQPAKTTTAKPVLNFDPKKLAEVAPSFSRSFGAQSQIGSVIGSATSNAKQQQKQEQQQQQQQQKRSTTISELSALAGSSTGSGQAKPEERHWSALENYYERLRGAQSPSTGNSNAGTIGLVPASSFRLRPVGRNGGVSPDLQGYYPVMIQTPAGGQPQQQLEVDDLPVAYRPVSSHSPLLASGSGLNVGRQPAFLLPLAAPSGTSGSMLSSSGSNDQISNYLALLQQQLTAGRIGSLSAGDSGSSLADSFGHAQRPIGGSSLLLDADSFEPQRVSSGSALATPLQPVAPQRSSVSGSGTGGSGKVSFLEWHKLPELLMLQQQQQRARHQYETFGASNWLARQRAQEQLFDQAYCGPRNYVKFIVNSAAATASAAGATKDSTASQPQAQLLSPVQLSRLQLQMAASQQAAMPIDVPVTLSAGEYPSHMGIYSGAPSDTNFLCAASWVHERFALTVASCVQQAAKDGVRLVARAGEWALHANQSSNSSTGTVGGTATSKLMVTRDIIHVHVFPKYNNDSREHNLALVELAMPIDYLDVPSVCPACQAADRSQTQATSCWTPVRSSVSSEYFDAEGEGETKVRKLVNMVEMPVRLLANDDNECFRQTKVEFFNFQHPNYICSADFKRADWRAKLNQTEFFGSGIYCNEAGNLSLVSMLHPIHAGSSSQFGYLDLSYYRPWMRNVISGKQTWK